MLRLAAPVFLHRHLQFKLLETLLQNVLQFIALKSAVEVIGAGALVFEPNLRAPIPCIMAGSRLYPLAFPDWTWSLSPLKLQPVSSGRTGPNRGVRSDAMVIRLSLDR